MYNFIDSTGVIVPDTVTLRDDVAAEWRTALGDDLVTTPDTPQGVLITGEVIARESVANNNAQLANQINPNLAGGVFLDAICALLGLEREAATRTVAQNVVLGGVPGTIIPAGSRARSLAGDVFETLGALVIGPGGTVIADMQAQNTGPIVTPAGALNTVVDMVLGWETVTNPLAGVLGSDEQSDVSLLSLRRVTLARQTISTREAQLSGLRDLPDVESAVFRENFTPATATIDGIVMTAHSVWACVDGGTDADVAMSLLKNKTDGAGWNGATTVNVVDPNSGQTYPVKFDRAVRVPVFVVVTVRRGMDTSDPVATIPPIIVDWAAGGQAGEEGLGIGVSVSPFEISAAINRVHPGYTVTNVQLSITGGTPAAAILPMTLKQRALIDVSYVSVVVVT